MEHRLARTYELVNDQRQLTIGPNEGGMFGQDQCRGFLPGRFEVPEQFGQALPDRFTRLFGIAEAKDRTGAALERQLRVGTH